MPQVSLSERILSAAVSEARTRLSGTHQPGQERRDPCLPTDGEIPTPVSRQTTEPTGQTAGSEGAAPSAAPVILPAAAAPAASSGDVVVLSSDDSPAPAASTAPASDPGHTRLVFRCIEALHHVIRRFPEHYKTVYRLAHYYFTSKTNRSVRLPDLMVVVVFVVS